MATSLTGVFFGLSYRFGTAITQWIQLAEGWLTVVVVLVLASLAVYFWRRRRRRKAVAELQQTDNSDETSDPADVTSREPEETAV